MKTSDDMEMWNDEQTPCEGDYVLSDTGALGAKTLVSIVGGKTLGAYDDFESAMVAIKADMEAGKFWPDVQRKSAKTTVARTTNTIANRMPMFRKTGNCTISARPISSKAGEVPTKRTMEGLRQSACLG